MGRECSTDGEMSSTYNILVGKRDGRSPAGRPKRKWEGNFEVDLREIGWESVDSI
jgi:hypothetical protein